MLDIQSEVIFTIIRCSNNVTAAHELSRKNGIKKVKKVCSNNLTAEGIVQGNDPYLYGEKVKAYMRKGARKLPGFEEFPNPQEGWGALCVRDSLPL